MLIKELNHKYSAFKRVLIFLIDLLLVLVIYALILFSVGTSLVTKLSVDDVKVVNSEFAKVALKFDVPTLDGGLYGLKVIDMDGIIDSEINSGKTSEDGFNRYNELNNLVNQELVKSEVYKESFNNFYRNYLFINILSMFTSLLIIELIVPLFSKKHQTLGMMLLKACLVSKNSFIILSKYQVLLRFFIILILEYLASYLFLNNFGLTMLILLSIASICFTKHRFTFSDAILKVKMAETEYSFNE